MPRHGPLFFAPQLVHEAALFHFIQIKVIRRRTMTYEGGETDQWSRRESTMGPVAPFHPLLAKLVLPIEFFNESTIFYLFEEVVVKELFGIGSGGLGVINHGQY